jgi:hypothetical protein
MFPCVDRFKEFEMADFSLGLDVFQSFEPGVEIDTGGAGALNLTFATGRTGRA